MLENLPRLSVLDDMQITPDERHSYRGLHKRKDLALETARMRIEVKFLRNIPVPDELTVSDWQ